MKWLNVALLPKLPVLLVLLALSAQKIVRAQDVENPREDRIKAALVYKILRFVHWPVDKADSAGRRDELFTLCVQGTALGGNLAELAGRQVAGQPINVTVINTTPSVGQCQAYFQAHGIPQVLTGTLTFSDTHGYTALGGMVGLVVRDNRVVIEINLRQVRRAGLEIDAPLLSIANVVKQD